MKQYLSIYMGFLLLWTQVAHNLPLLSINGCKDTDSSKTSNNSFVSEVFVTPEQFGAIGDGRLHKLSEKYRSINEAKTDYPFVENLDITIDGAAFQKAVDMASLKAGTVIAVKNYLINFPILTKSNVIIDGKGTGKIINDRTAERTTHRFAFYFGDYQPLAFNKEGNNDAGFNLYQLKNGVRAGQDFVQLAKLSDAGAFKIGQLVMVSSLFKRTQGSKKILLPYHITVCKIVNIESGKLSFEYPFDETLDSAEVAANGNFDPQTGINFEGVQNVTLRNMFFDAEHITGRTYAYNCHLENLTIDNAVRVIGVNAFSRSSMSNIKGNFGWRGIEIKTGSHHLLMKNISISYKSIHGYKGVTDMMSAGQYCREITLDSFTFNGGDASYRHALITLRARKTHLSNGVVEAYGQKKPFVEFANEKYVSDEKFGCFGNVLDQIRFISKPQMKILLEMGERPEDKKSGPSADLKVDELKEQNKNRKKDRQEDDMEDDKSETIGMPFLTDIPPSDNKIINCYFNTGNPESVIDLNEGRRNIITDCIIKNIKIRFLNDFENNNTVLRNKAQ